MPSRFPIAVLALILAAGSLSVPAQARVHDPARYVNPYLGTKPGAPDQGTGGGAGNNFPGADVPFGMVQRSPDTVTEQHGGYFYDDNRIKGFSLTHLSGAGCDTYQDIPFLPISGEVTESPPFTRIATSPGSPTGTKRSAPAITASGWTTACTPSSR
ncbi:hypothetical protein [Sciscionella sediminilitoris]|uniref:hypothetical protein n=1 Tax=Sciscionella sediminilitoris TaxID=1445613 RepID=UPI00068F1E13|nr:hypothetical protein [Sciscionella sp. SE31]